MVSLAPDQTFQSYGTFWGSSVGTVGVEESLKVYGRRKISLSDMFPEPNDYKKDHTSKAIETADLLLGEDYIEEIDAPLMPPKKEFKVKLIVKSIERLKPSVCNDLEIW